MVQLKRREESRSVLMGFGGQFVMTIGTQLMLMWFVSSLDMEAQVRL